MSQFDPDELSFGMVNGKVSWVMEDMVWVIIYTSIGLAFIGSQGS